MSLKGLNAGTVTIDEFPPMEQTWHVDETDNIQPYCGNCGERSYRFEKYKYCSFCGCPVIHTEPKKGGKT